MFRFLIIKKVTLSLKCPNWARIPHTPFLCEMYETCNYPNMRTEKFEIAIMHGAYIQ